MAAEEERVVEAAEIITAESGTLAILTKSEIDTQIATAHKFPRSIKKFRDEAMEMVTLTERIAEECMYALPRDGKTIEGPSARFAEIIASAWGNCRAGARVVGEEADFVVAQGVFHDLERNVAITYEIKRRIVDKYNRRYKPDMIGVTANAACSIGLRNAVLKGIPKAFWADMYDAARKTAIGDAKTLTNKRTDMFAYFQKLGANAEMICATLGVSGVEDIGLEELATLKGVATAIKEGDTTVEQAFSIPVREEKTGKGVQGLKDALAKKEEPAAQASTPPQEEKPKEGQEAAQAGGESAGGESLPFGSARPAREPGADEQEDREDLVPKETSAIPQFLARHKGIEDLESRWKAVYPLVEKASKGVGTALKKNFEDLMSKERKQ